MLLKELMKEAGFSQYRLAVESGVPHATLSGLQKSGGKAHGFNRGMKAKKLFAIIGQ